MMMKETSQELRMLSRSLSDCQTLTLNVNMQLALREPRVFHLWVAWYQVYSWRPTHQCCTNKYEVGLESVWPCWCLCYAHTAISEGRPIDHVWKLWQLSPVEEREGNTFIMLWRATKCVDIKEPLLRSHDFIKWKLLLLDLTKLSTLHAIGLTFIWPSSQGELNNDSSSKVIRENIRKTGTSQVNLQSCQGRNIKAGTSQRKELTCCLLCVLAICGFSPNFSNCLL